MMRRGVVTMNMFVPVRVVVKLEMVCDRLSRVSVAVPGTTVPGMTMTAVTGMSVAAAQCRHQEPKK